MPWDGAACISDGITIDLSDLKGITLSQNRAIGSFGSAARWVDVYEKLDPLGIVVPGVSLRNSRGWRFDYWRWAVISSKKINPQCLIYR